VVAAVSSLTITAIVLCCLIAGSLLGMWFAARLPEPSRSSESRDAIKLATDILSVFAALVLGLLIADTKSAFDATDAQIRQFATTLILLHQTLADYGPETAEPRMMLRNYTARALADNWQGERGAAKELDHVETGKLLEAARNAILRLPGGSPRRDALRTDAASEIEDALKMRLLLVERPETSIKPLFLEILIAWITLIFLSFGYTAPRNAIAATALFLSAAALAACIFLIVEMDAPFDGVIRVSSLPMRNALAQMTSEPGASDRTQ
jgi:hypothetical protein